MNNFLQNLSGSNLVFLASLFSVIISEGLTSDEIGLLGDFFSALGDNLSLISGTMPNNNS